LHRLFDKKGPYFSEREIYLFGSSDYQITTTELTYRANKELGYSLNDVCYQYQEEKEVEGRQYLAFWAAGVAANESEKITENGIVVRELTKTRTALSHRNMDI